MYSINSDMRKSRMPLFNGIFRAKIATIDTAVTFTIMKNYEVKADFCSHGENYQFNMKLWKKTNQGTKNPYSSFDYFYTLFMERYGDTPDNFGTYKTSEEGPKVKRTEENVVNVLKYACYEVFLCAEEIINTHRRSLLDYCIYFREKNSQIDTYEMYIHLVACHCLVHCNFFAPTTKFSAIEFRDVPREYMDSIMKAVKTKETNNSDSEDE